MWANLRCSRVDESTRNDGNLGPSRTICEAYQTHQLLMDRIVAADNAFGKPLRTAAEELASRFCALLQLWKGRSPILKSLSNTKLVLVEFQISERFRYQKSRTCRRE